MKKSTALTLVLLSTTTILMTACLEDSKRSEPQMFKSEQECLAKINDKDVCHNAFIGAQKDHDLNSPKFASKTECENEMGASNCYQNQAQGGGFSPIMTYFIISSLINNNNMRHQYEYSSVYQTRAGGLFTGRCNDGRCNNQSPNFVGSTGSHGMIYNPAFTSSWRNREFSTPSVSRDFKQTMVNGKTVFTPSEVSASAPSTRSGFTVSRGGFGGSMGGEGAGE